MDYEKMWIKLKSLIMTDLEDMANPEVDMNSERIINSMAGKVALNTMTMLEKGEL